MKGPKESKLHWEASLKGPNEPQNGLRRHLESKSARTSNFDDSTSLLIVFDASEGHLECPKGVQVAPGGQLEGPKGVRVAAGGQLEGPEGVHVAAGGQLEGPEELQVAAGVQLKGPSEGRKESKLHSEASLKGPKESKLHWETSLKDPNEPQNGLRRRLESKSARTSNVDDSAALLMVFDASEGHLKAQKESKLLEGPKEVQVAAGGQLKGPKESTWQREGSWKGPKDSKLQQEAVQQARQGEQKLSQRAPGAKIRSILAVH